MQKYPSPGLKRVGSSQLMVITESKELSQPQVNEKFSSLAFSEFTVGSPKIKLSHQKENFNLNKMSSQDLKKSVETNPFMRAKLKCFIRHTQQSLNKDKHPNSPKFATKPRFEQLSNMLSARMLEKQRKQKEKMRVQDFERFIKENEKHYQSVVVGMGNVRMNN